MLTYILFILGFVLLIKGADLLVEGSASIARAYNIPPIVIGLTIVAFGTSSPELVVNVFASMQGNTDIAIGNIIGSNIANILLILGVSSCIYPLVTKKNTIWKEIPLSMLGVLLLWVLVNDAFMDGSAFSGLTRSDGIVFLSFFIIFLYYTFGIAKVTGEYADVDDWSMSKVRASSFVLLGLLGLALGGSWIVNGAVAIAEFFGVSQSLVALTIVAIGTSLPELATSAVAAYKKEADIAVGNIVGSNIFNIFFVLGVSATLHPIPFTLDANKDILVAIGASAVLFFTMFIGKRHTLEKWQGAGMVLAYVVYIAYLVSLG